MYYISGEQCCVVIHEMYACVIHKLHKVDHYSFVCIGLIFKIKPCFMCHQVHMCNKHLCTFVVYIVWHEMATIRNHNTLFSSFNFTTFSYFIFSIEYQFINFILASIRISKADPAPARRDRAPCS